MKKTIILLLFLFSVSYTKGQDINATGFLKGKWVKVSSERDTIEFLDAKYCVLRLQNDPDSQNSNGGMYSYIIQESGIVLNPVKSGTLNRDKPACYFNLNKEYRLLTISNFYSAPNSGHLITFKKIDIR